MPERLSDTINVKDWGARGNNSANDAAAIQAAIDYALSTAGGTKPSGGIVFFPPGIYRTYGTAINVGSNSDPYAKVILRGSGGSDSMFSQNCKIDGNVNGYILSKGNRTYDALQRVERIDIGNGNTTPGSGCVKLTGNNVAVERGYMGGMNCIDASAANGCTISDIYGNGKDHPTGPGTPYGKSAYGVGIYMGNGCVVNSCRFQGDFWCAFAISGTGACLLGGSSEVLNMSVRLGWSPAGETPAIGCLVQGLQTEDNTIGIELYNAIGCVVQGNFITGDVSTWGGSGGPAATVSAASYNPADGYITATSNNHGLPTTAVNEPLFLSASPSFYAPGTFSFVTYVDSNHFKYFVGTGLSAPAFSSGSWQYALLAGLRFRKASGCTIMSNYLSSQAGLGAVDFDFGSSETPSGNVHSNNVFINNGSFYGLDNKAGFLPPTNTKNLAAWHFIQAGNTPITGNSLGQATTLVGLMSYSDLPGQSGVTQSGPIEGQEYIISNCTNATSFGVAATYGVGGAHAKVRFNGTTWVVC
jgi:hypothetical protein